MHFTKKILTVLDIRFCCFVISLAFAYTDKNMNQYKLFRSANNAQNISDLCLTTLGMVEYKRRQIDELKVNWSGQLVIVTTCFNAKSPRVSILSVRITTTKHHHNHTGPYREMIAA